MGWDRLEAGDNLRKFRKENPEPDPLAALSLDELLLDVRDHERSRPDEAAVELRRRFLLLEEEKAEAVRERDEAYEDSRRSLDRVNRLVADKTGGIDPETSDEYLAHRLQVESEGRIVAVRERDEARERLRMACEPCAECGHIDYRELDDVVPPHPAVAENARLRNELGEADEACRMMEDRLNRLIAGSLAAERDLAAAREALQWYVDRDTRRTASAQRAALGGDQ